jgi:hypothetical protein
MLGKLLGGTIAIAPYEKDICRRGWQSARRLEHADNQ